jgi:hypothetical protein
VSEWAGAASVFFAFWRIRPGDYFLRVTGDRSDEVASLVTEILLHNSFAPPA